MPIDGLTDAKSAGAQLRHMSIGKLVKGRKTDTRQGMEDLSFFRWKAKRGYESVERAYYEVYGSEPRVIPAYLPFHSVEENWTTWKEKWGDKIGLMHRCTGTYMVQWLNDEKRYERDYELVRKVPCYYGPLSSGAPDDKPCKQVGRLSVILPDLLEYLMENPAKYGMAGIVPFATVITKSVHDLGTLTRELYSLHDQGGSEGLAGMPVVLRRILEEVGVSFEKDGSAVKTKGEKWMLHIAMTPQYLKQKIAAANARRDLIARTGATPEQLALLPASATGEEEEVVEGEFVATLDDTESPFGNGEEDAPEQQAANGNGSSRPLPPAKLREFLHRKVTKRLNDDESGAWAGEITAKQIKLLNSKLNECFAPDPQKEANKKRHSVLGWLWEGRQSATELTKAEAGVAIDWLLAPDADQGTYDLHPSASREAAAVLKCALAEAGQQEMALNEAAQ